MLIISGPAPEIALNQAASAKPLSLAVIVEQHHQINERKF